MHQVPEPLAQLAELRLDLLDDRSGRQADGSAEHDAVCRAVLAEGGENDVLVHGPSIRPRSRAARRQVRRAITAASHDDTVGCSAPAKRYSSRQASGCSLQIAQ